MLEARTRVGTGIQVELFATNLHTPSHMEWTAEGRLLVSEPTAGRIIDITDGGDMRDAEPFAWGLEGPASILPMPDGRLLVSEMWSGRVSDITGGGEMSQRTPFADGLRGPYSLSRIGGSVFVVESPNSFTTQITDITVHGEHKPYVTNIPGSPLAGLEGLTPLESWPDRWQVFFEACKTWKTPLRIAGTDELVLNSSALGLLIRVPEGGGDFGDFLREDSPLASGLGSMGGMIQHSESDLLYVTQPVDGSITAVDPNQRRDYRFDPPVVRGLNMPTCVRFSPDGESMLVCSIATGGVWRITNFA